MKLEDFDSSVAAPFVKHFEGFRAYAYKCPAGVWTIGYGHTQGVKEGDTVTIAVADTYLFFDLEDTKDALAKHVTNDALTEAQCVALVSLAFNVGASYVVHKCPKLMKAVNEGRTDDAAKEFLDITKAGGVELPGLVRRRKAEADLYAKGFSHEIY